MLRHPDGCDDAVQGKNDVQDEDLGDCRPEPERGIADLLLTPSTVAWISTVPLASRKSPPAAKMTSRKETECPNTAKSGLVSPPTTPCRQATATG